MVRRTPRTVPSRRPLQPALGAGATSFATASAARSASDGGSPRPHAAEARTTATSRQERRAANTRLPRRRPLLGHERDVLLGGALQAIAQHARQVQEDLGRDARVAELDTAEEALVHGKHLEVARRADSWPSFTPTRSQSVITLVVASSAGKSTRFAPSEAAMVKPVRMPKFWIGTKLENPKVRKPKKSATVVYTIGTPTVRTVRTSAAT